VKRVEVEVPMEERGVSEKLYELQLLKEEKKKKKKKGIELNKG
jgi:hypothetical protein